MKKIVVVAAVLVVGLVAFNYLTTGSITLIPAFDTSEEARALKDLEDRLDAAAKRYSQATRTAGLSGLDTTADAEAARRELRRIEKDLKSLRKRLSADSEIRRADELAAAVRLFSEKLS